MPLYSTDGKFGGGIQNPNWMGKWGNHKMRNTGRPQGDWGGWIPGGVFSGYVHPNMDTKMRKPGRPQNDLVNIGSVGRGGVFNGYVHPGSATGTTGANGMGGAGTTGGSGSFTAPMAGQSGSTGGYDGGGGGISGGYEYTGNPANYTPPTMGQWQNEYGNWYNVPDLGNDPYSGNPYGYGYSRDQGWTFDIRKLLEMLNLGDLPDEYGGYNYKLPGNWDPSNYDIPELKTSPWDVVESLRPLLNEQVSKGFGEAAQRFGASGGGGGGGLLRGTPYARALGDVERGALADLNREVVTTQYDASKLQAQMEQAQRENALNRALEAWGQMGGWQMGNQSQDASQLFGGWQQYGNWQMQDQGNQQQMMMQLLQMLLPYASRIRWR